MFLPPLLVVLIWNLREQPEMGMWRRYAMCAPNHARTEAFVQRFNSFSLLFARFALLAQAVTGE